MGQKRDRSYGIIPLRRNGSDWEIFIIKHRGGHWAFPKGHPEENEEPKACAERELLEESGLRITSFLLENTFSETYRFRHRGDLIIKTVIYFAAEVDGEVVLQLDEVIDHKWVPIDSAGDHLTFNEAREICASVASHLSNESQISS